ncbi:MAG: hypothetical protein RB292_00020 [Patescibacteria group bacterium]|jgi:hypothetical protein|nr:hypothetical protein [Patescibacteria group bacterium]
MAEDQNKNNDDFFSLIAKDQKIQDPFATDEILFQDANGNLKILKGGKVFDYQTDSSKPETEDAGLVEPPVEVVAEPPPPVAVIDSSLTQEIKPPIVPLASKVDFDQEVDGIVRKAEIKFEDAEAARRFRSIIISRLRGIRDQVQTREALLSSPLLGGMGFDDLITDKILSLINQHSHDLHDKLRQEVSTEPFSDLRAEARKILDQPLTTVPSITFQKASSSPSGPRLPKPTQTPVLSKASVTAPEPEPEMSSRPIISESTSRPKIEDIKFKPKLIGPVEEIGSMTLVDFRRLSKDPLEATKKIMEKIDFLEAEESFSKRIEAIRAWKRSEVYGIYLAIGDQSMEEKKPISEIIAQRQAQNQPTLSSEEFEAIIEFNNKIRY